MVSRKADNILREAERKAEKGAKELLIIAQDTAAYGKGSETPSACLMTAVQ